MTVAAQSSQSVFLGNDSTSTWTFPWVGVVAADVNIYYIDGNGNQTLLSPTQYNLTLNTAAPGQLWGIGGSVTYPKTGSPIANGTSLLVQRAVPYAQPTNVANQTAYPLSVQSALDTLCFEIQQIASRTGQIRGTWATGVQYYAGDTVTDGANGANTTNRYTATGANVSGVWSADLASGLWSLALDVQNINKVVGAYLPLTGGVVTGGISAANFVPTGTAKPVSGYGIYLRDTGEMGFAGGGNGYLWVSSAGYFLGSIGDSGTQFGCDSTNPLEAPFSGSNSPSKTGIAFVYNFTGSWSGQNQAIMGTVYNNSPNSGAAGVAGNAIALGAGAVGWGLTSEATVAGAGSAAFGLEAQVNMLGNGNGIGIVLNFGGDTVHNGNTYILMRNLTAGNAPGTSAISLDASSLSPIAAGASILQVIGNTLSCTNGIDISLGAYSGAAWKSPGCTIDGVGNAAVKNLRLSNGFAIIDENSNSQIQFNTAASAGHFLTVTNSNGGSPCLGTNAGNLLLAPNGGFVEFGAYVNTPATSAGYITIHDGAGVPRNLMVGT